jgi:hypothetical protein
MSRESVEVEFGHSVVKESSGWRMAVGQQCAASKPFVSPNWDVMGLLPNITKQTHRRTEVPVSLWEVDIYSASSLDC